ncbi:MAG: outer membrane protein assembly factor BamA [Chloroherpetonaceae bacterium]|nr:outer membrane protein assembly factor BamA [Chloroherpetonaceae bacterium]
MQSKTIAQETPEDSLKQGQNLDFSEPVYDGDTPTRYRILGISIEGLSTIEEKDVLARFPIQVGQEITVPGFEIANAVKRLWRQRLFSEIKIEIEKKTDEGVFLLVRVREYPVLSAIEFEGNDELDEEDLQKQALLIKGSTITEQSIAAAKTRILKKYEEKGFLRAEITHELLETSNGRATLKFKIRENNRVIIDRITFHGNQVIDRGDLLGALEETKQNNLWRSIFGRPKLDRRKYEEDKQKLLAFYRERGFRDARILRDSITYSEDKSNLFLDVFISEGPKYVIRNVTWEGNTLYPTETLESVFGFKKGDVFNDKKIKERLTFSQDGGDINSLYTDRGYLTFRAMPEETVVAGDSVDIRIVIVEGNQFKIRQVSIKGNTKTKDHVIRRELYTLPGDLFSRENIIRSVRQLATINYFDSEKINPDIQPRSEDQVDITYELAEKQTDTFNASAGYSQFIGLTGALGLTFNNFSIQDVLDGSAYKPLPHGDGQRLDFQWQFGNFNFQTLSLSFTEPWAFGTPLTLGMSIFDTQQNFTGFIRQTGFTISVGRRLTFPDDYFRLDYSFRYQRNEGGLINFGIFDANAPNVASEFSITQIISRNSTDNPIYSRRGSDFSFTAQLSGGPLPGSVNFYKFTARNAWFSPLAGDLVLMLSAEGGYLGRFSENDFIPFINTFFMGNNGISFIPTIPLRGYEPQSIGALVAGRYTGDLYTKFVSEIRYPLSLNPSAQVYVLAFAEAGNVWLRGNDVNLADLKRSAGIGVRIFLPIVGLVGFDYGFGFDTVPVDRDNNTGALLRQNQGWKFIFTFGQFAR